MISLVYRLPSPKGFVYRNSLKTLHKVFCGWWMSHNRACGSYFAFYHPQNKPGEQ